MIQQKKPEETRPGLVGIAGFNLNNPAQPIQSNPTSAALANVPDMYQNQAAIPPVSLSMPKTVGQDYSMTADMMSDNGVSADDSRVLKKQFDQAASFEPIGKTAQIGLQDKDAGGPIATDSQDDAQFRQQINDAAKAGAQLFGQISQSMQQGAANEYNADMQDWNAQGKYWFNPNAALEPDLDKYLDEMPSATDSLRDSMMIKDNGSAGSNVGGALLNPMAIKGVGSTADKVFGQGAGFSAYVGDKAMQGAIKSGWVGGIIGAIEGIWTWNTAAETDKKNKRKMRQVYEIELQNWQANRFRAAENVRVKEEDKLNTARSERAAKVKAEKRAADEKVVSSSIKKRQQIMQALVTANTLKTRNKQERLEQWK